MYIKPTFLPFFIFVLFSLTRTFLTNFKTIMPDLFDNIFNKIGTKFTGGKTTNHYGGASQVNTGKWYSYTSSASNNNYWLPRESQTKTPGTQAEEPETVQFKVDRSMSVGSITEDSGAAGAGGDRSRMNSITE